MLQRLAILMLVTAIPAAAVTTCPRPAGACPMSVQARHACCEHVALREAGCCCGANQRGAQLVSTAARVSQDQGVKLLAVVPGWQPSLAGVVGRLGARNGQPYDPAPPDTPIHNHIQLLL